MKRPPPPPVDWEVVRVIRIIDGDTVDLLVRRDLGTLDAFTIQAVGPIRVRLVHLDTPERGEEGFTEATNDLRYWLDIQSIIGLRVVTQGVDGFGRDLADIYSAANRAETATDYMVRGHGWPAWTG